MPGVPLYYYSSSSRLTERGALKVAGEDREAFNLADAAVRRSEPAGPWVLVTPSYKTGNPSNDTVPEAVRRFLESPVTRRRLVGVIGAGDRNFAEYFVAAARWVCERSGRPLLGTFEKMGTPEEIEALRQALAEVDAALAQEVDSEPEDL